MTTEFRNYGVYCKNPECDAVLTIGEKLSIAPPAHGGEVFQWPQPVAGTHTCPRCGQTFEYTEEDYQEFKFESSVLEPLSNPAPANKPYGGLEGSRPPHSVKGKRWV